MLLERISPGVIKSRFAQGILHLVLASTLWEICGKELQPLPESRGSKQAWRQGEGFDELDAHSPNT